MKKQYFADWMDELLYQDFLELKFQTILYVLKSGLYTIIEYKCIMSLKKY